MHLFIYLYIFIQIFNYTFPEFIYQCYFSKNLDWDYFSFLLIFLLKFCTEFLLASRSYLWLWMGRNKALRIVCAINDLSVLFYYYSFATENDGKCSLFMQACDFIKQLNEEHSGKIHRCSSSAEHKMHAK